MHHGGLASQGGKDRLEGHTGDEWDHNKDARRDSDAKSWGKGEADEMVPYNVERS